MRYSEQANRPDAQVAYLQSLVYCSLVMYGQRHQEEMGEIFNSPESRIADDLQKVICKTGLLSFTYDYCARNSPEWY